MVQRVSRRSFLEGLAALGAAPVAAVACPEPALQAAGAAAPRRASRPVVISSANGWHDNAKRAGLPPKASAVETALRLLRDPAVAARSFGLLEAIVAGVAVVEDDPEDHSVGLGGLPNEDGVVQLDASVMFGPTHQSGAVAAVENIQNVAKLALIVLRYTDHSFIVGPGAYKLARAFGLPHVDLLTDEARQIWLYWKQKHSDRDDWLPPPDAEVAEWLKESTHGTIHLSAVDGNGNVASTTTTSGLSFKLSGRIGDSPVIGAGNFCDNEVGAAGATGRGEEAIVNGAAHGIVEFMRGGMDPDAACLEMLKRIAGNAKKRGLLRDDGIPNFDITFYALRNDGAYGSASMFAGRSFAVVDASSMVGRHEPCGYLYEK